MTDVSIHAHGDEVYGSARIVTEDLQTVHSVKVPAYAELTLRVADTTLHLFVCQEAARGTAAALRQLAGVVEELEANHARPNGR